MRKFRDLGLGKSSKMNTLISMEVEKLCVHLSEEIKGRFRMLL